MSRPQKSFFARDSSRVNYRPFSASRYNGQHNYIAGPKAAPYQAPAMPPPPIEPAPRARAKLKAFQFIEGRPSGPGERGSQEVDDEKSRVEVSAARNNHDLSGAGNAIEDVENSPPKAFPSTPATRLPLADLIGNSEDNGLNTNATLISPHDRVQWHPGKSPASSQTRVTPRSIGRKRARSSSPSSESQSFSARNARTEPLDLHGLQDTLKTPHIDPAADLWTRYAVSSTRDSPSAKPTLPFAHLLDSSSPQSASHNAGSVSGLRRWTSCGVEWPSAKRKKRKVQHDIHVDIEDVFADLPRLPDQDKIVDQRPGRIGALVDRIQSTLAKPPERGFQHAPSSSSPLPDRTQSFGHAVVTPSRSKIVRLSEMPQNLNAKDGSPDLPQHNEMSIVHAVDPSSSYSSDELDVNELETLTNNDNKPETNPQKLSVPVLNDNTIAAQSLKAPTATTSIQLDLDDPFSDEDICEADFAEAAASCEQPNLTNYSQAVQCNCAKGNAIGSQSVIPSDDDFDDDIDEAAFVVAEALASQQSKVASRPAHEPPHDRPVIQRFQITNVYEGKYTTADGRSHTEKVLLVEEAQTKLCKAITLRESWVCTHCEKDTYIHIVGAFSKTGQCLIDDSHGLIVVHPDHLISATVVADSFGCVRRAVLQDRIKATSDPAAPSLYGHLLHEIFQEAMTANRWSDQALMKLTDAVIERNLEDVYAVKLSVAETKDHLSGKLPKLQAWARLFVNEVKKDDAFVMDRNEKVNMSINKLLDIEEHIWSPLYGLKGNIDATIEATMHSKTGKQTLTLPLELKTGKNTTSTSHRAQTALYTLLISDRYDLEVMFGILYYMETSETFRIPALRHEIRHMILQRNELAHYMRTRHELPVMLKDPRVCGRCYAQTSCFLYHKLSEGGDAESSGMGESFDQLTRKLSPAHQSFFRHWDDLLSSEETEMMKHRRELWTMTSIERERLGRCFANVVLDLEAEHGLCGTQQKINKFQYTFKPLSQGSDLPFKDSQIGIGEPIVISDEQSHYALALGYVTKMATHRITVAVDRQLHRPRTRLSGFDSKSNQTFAGIMTVGGKNGSTTTSTEDAPRFRIDKDEFSNGLATVRNNLLQIMNDDVFQSRRIRELVVDNAAPQFDTSERPTVSTTTTSESHINIDQQKAIDKILSAKDYAIVLGMPGTGKTTTIAHIIRNLAAKGKSVLLASYTHTAVDNILLKIRHDNIKTLRIGAIAKIHPEVQQFVDLAAEPKSTIEEIEKSYQEPQVVATTCLGINHQIFNERIFDYCIVDEASQITLPVCLGPIRMARTFVLVGDHYQLPPLVQNEAAREGGLDVSLFKYLSEAHPTAVATLRHQYRMNEEIMSLSNKLVYDGRLVCGLESIARRRLRLPQFDAGLKNLHHDLSRGTKDVQSACNYLTSQVCWLAEVLGPHSSPVVFLDTDTLSPNAREVKRNSRITNPIEASVTAQLVRSLLGFGVPAKTIGVVTLYRSQLALIKSILRSSEYGIQQNDAEEVEAHTADRYQGRDKDVIVLSYVRSNDEGVVGNLLKDWRRVNVAMTRAKKKLIILGSRETLAAGDEVPRKMVDLCHEQGWIYAMPHGLQQDGWHKWHDNWTSGLEEANVRSPPKAASQSPRQNSENSSNAARKVGSQKILTPSKHGIIRKSTTGDRALGSNVLQKRAVLADIINDVLGRDI